MRININIFETSGTAPRRLPRIPAAIERRGQTEVVAKRKRVNTHRFVAVEEKKTVSNPRRNRDGPGRSVGFADARADRCASAKSRKGDVQKDLKNVAFPLMKFWHYIIYISISSSPSNLAGGNQKGHKASRWTTASTNSSLHHSTSTQRERH